jgi:type I restriction enzyme S subunit
MKWRNYQKFIVNTATGSTVRHTSPTKILEFNFLLPSPSEQQAIASILSSFDDKIELLRQQNKTLGTLGQTIFQEWFGKYGVDDELPEGWRVGKLGKLDFVSF